LMNYIPIVAHHNASRRTSSKSLKSYFDLSLGKVPTPHAHLEYEPPHVPIHGVKSPQHPQYGLISGKAICFLQTRRTRRKPHLVPACFCIDMMLNPSITP